MQRAESFDLTDNAKRVCVTSAEQALAVIRFEYPMKFVASSAYDTLTKRDWAIYVGSSTKRTYWFAFEIDVRNIVERVESDLRALEETHLPGTPSTGNAADADTLSCDTDRG